MLGKHYSLRGWSNRIWNKLPREVVMVPSLLLFKRHLVDSQIPGLTFRLLSVESGVGLDPCGSLPTRGILWFSEIILHLFNKKSN